MSTPEPGRDEPRSGWRLHLSRRNAAWAALAAVGLLVLAQLVPYGRDHSNPPETRAARWTDPEAEQLFRDSCGDCHSNSTEWRWYANVAPASWLVQRDVDGGREHLNLSRWELRQPDLGEVTGAIQSGEMPPLQYTLAHPSARLDEVEKQKLIAGLQRLFASDPPGALGEG
jgi:hypothetical protein